VWKGRTRVSLPGDIRPLIDATYRHRDEKGKMARWLYELENGTRLRKGRKELRQLARFTLSRDAKTLTESKAQTRYGEEPGCDVLLLRSIEVNSQSHLTEIELLNGKRIEIPWLKTRLDKRGWRRLGVCLMKQVVRVRLRDAPLPLGQEYLRRLRLDYCFYIGRPEEDEAVLRLALVDTSGRLRGFQDTRVHDQKHLMYRQDIGYRVVKQQGNAP